MTERESRQPISRNVMVGDNPVRVQLAPDGRLSPKVALLGPNGTFGEIATNKLLGDQKFPRTLFVEAPQHEIIRQVDKGEFDLGVIAIETASEGEVKKMLKALLASKNTQILGETILRVEHNLLMHPEDVVEGERQRVQAILSHHQATDQCEEFIRANFPGTDLIETLSTAAGAKQVAQRVFPYAAAIGSRDAAQKHGLVVVKANIEDSPHNATRFYLLGRGETEPTGNDHTLIAFTLKDDYPGAEHEVSGVFAEYEINRTKVDSHVTGKLDRYGFLVRIDGHQKEGHIAEALAMISDKFCSELRVIGSYAKGEVPEGAEDPGVLTMNGESH